jgi:ketosteroid isomerase-like protein
MSQENVDLVRRGFEAFNLGGREARASEAMLAPDVVWEVAIGIGDFDGVYNGRAEVRRFWQTWMAEFEDMHLDIDELVGCGERVFSAVRLLGRGRHSGVVVPTTTVFPVFTLRDGLMVRYQLFADRQRALEAAGLSQQNAHGDS